MRVNSIIEQSVEFQPGWEEASELIVRVGRPRGCNYLPDLAGRQGDLYAAHLCLM